MALTLFSFFNQPLFHSPTIHLQGKRKRKVVPKSLQDFSAFQETLAGADLSAKKRVLKAKTSTSKCKILEKETKRLSAVVSHPQFQINPLKAIQTHINTVYS